MTDLDLWTRLNRHLEAIKKAGIAPVEEELKPVFRGSNKTREQILKEYQIRIRRVEAHRKRWPGW